MKFVAFIFAFVRSYQERNAILGENIFGYVGAPLLGDVPLFVKYASSSGLENKIKTI